MNAFGKPTVNFRYYGPFITLWEAYNEGYHTGLDWDEDYHPGGPHVLTEGVSPDEDWVKACAYTKQVHQEWLRGFDDARKGR
jgi:hypothetical protein